MGGGDQLCAGTMFLATLYFALPLLGKSRPLLAFLPMSLSEGYSQRPPTPPHPPSPNCGAGALAVGGRSFVLGKGILRPQHPRLGGGDGAALNRGFSYFAFISCVF